MERTSPGIDAAPGAAADGRSHLVADARNSIVISATVRVAFFAPLALFAWAAWTRRWVADDGYIYLRVVRELVGGHGPVFNGGERVEAATSPLWVGILALADSLHLPISLPWLAVILGLSFSVAGLAFALFAATDLWRRDARVLLPFGALVVIALPPFWDFATSGLETGLSFVWLGATFYVLVRAGAAIRSAASAGRLRTALFLALAGLGPLIHPDFAIFTLAFIAAFFVVAGESRPLRRFEALVVALFIPGLYELFRMGYYGALVPNPAFAKEAGTSNWPQGWHYLLDTVNPYWLAIPLLLVVAMALHVSRDADRSTSALVFAPIGAAIAHGLYVVYVGGDFMHTRYFLPDIFAFALPIAVIPFDARPRVAAALAMAVWALVCAAMLHVPYSGVGPHDIANEREIYVTLSGNAHPITVEDYAQSSGEVAAAFGAYNLAPGSLRLVHGFQTKLRGDLADTRLLEAEQIGIFSYVVPPDVYVEDRYGLADALASHIKLEQRGRPGHEKELAEAWIVARFTDPGAKLPFVLGPPARDVAAARAARVCDGPRELLAAATAPMSFGRFASNVVESFRSYGLRIPGDPKQAKAELC
jgi:arabinofuranosyltransferase